MAYDVAKLLTMSQSELDALFTNSAAGNIPPTTVTKAARAPMITCRPIDGSRTAIGPAQANG